jgi:peptide/nickel transport system substrate-binding protein
MVLAACSQPTTTSTAPTAPASTTSAAKPTAAAGAPTAAVATAAAGPTVASSSGSTSGALVIAEIANLSKTLHPYPSDESYDQGWTDAAALIWSGALIDFDWNTLEYVPGMATAMPAISNNGKTFTFTLRDDLKWSDGSPITVEDFTYAWDQASQEENAWVEWDQTGEIDSYKALDAKTIEVTLKETKPTDVALGLADLITPVPSKVWKGKSWTDPSANPEILKPTVVLGPYKVQSFDITSRGVFVPVDTFFKGKPVIPRIEMVPYQQPTLVLDAVKNGSANFAIRIPPSLWKDAKADPNLNALTWTAANAGYRLLQYNLNRPILQDKNMREALARAINRADVVDLAEEGLATPQFSFLTPANTKWANPNVEHYDFDMTKAKQLLQSAGYTLQNGTLMDKSGQPVHLQVVYPTSSQPRAKIATYMQQQYRELGIDLEVKGLDFNAFTDQVSARRDFDLALGSYGGGSLDPDLGSKAQFITNGQSNVTGYTNTRIDDLFKQGQNELDGAKRKQIYDEIQQIVANDLPSFYIDSYQSPSAPSKKVQGIVPSKGSELYYNDAVMAWSVQQ